jgi:hypothetical protein
VDKIGDMATLRKSQQVGQHGRGGVVRLKGREAVGVPKGRHWHGVQGVIVLIVSWAFSMRRIWHRLVATCHTKILWVSQSSLPWRLSMRDGTCSLFRGSSTPSDPSKSSKAIPM